MCINIYIFIYNFLGGDKNLVGLTYYSVYYLALYNFSKREKNEKISAKETITTHQTILLNSSEV